MVAIDRTFRFPKTKAPPPTTRRTKGATLEIGEQLTGLVQGKKASDLEERTARALERIGLGYVFQYNIYTQYTLPDQEKKVDFIIQVGGQVQPLEVYGLQWHKTEGDVLLDSDRERELNEVFARLGWEPVKILWSWQLFDQEAADAAVKELLA